MNSPAQQLAERLRDAARTPSATVEPTRVPPAGPPIRTRPIRVTADLPPRTYRTLNALTQDLAAALARPRVHQVEVIRALIELAGDGSPLAQQIRDAVVQQVRR